MRRWRTALIMVLLLALFIGVFIYVGRRQRAWDPIADHASFRTNPSGTKALRELCKLNGLATDTFKRPLKEFAISPTALLCVFDPSFALTDDEFVALTDWVKDGGHLIFAAGDDQFTDGCCGRSSCSPFAKCGANRIFLAHLGLATQPQEPDDNIVAVQPANRAPWTAAVTKLKVDSSRRLIRLTSAEQLTEHLREMTGEDNQVPEVTPVQTERTEPVVADAAGVLVMNLRLGQGNIDVISDADILANGTIGEADNAILAMNLIYSRGRPAVIYFDEYHHGLRAQAFADEKLPGAPIFAALWAALGCLGLYLSGSFWRLGRPVPLPGPSRRSIVEHIQAFAGLYQAAMAGGAAVNLVSRHFRWRLAQLTALGPSASPQQVATACARTADIQPEALARLLTELQSITPDTKLSHAQTLDLIRRIAHFEEVIFGDGKHSGRATENL